MSWESTEKYFFDPTFGGALDSGPAKRVSDARCAHAVCLRRSAAAFFTYRERSAGSTPGETLGRTVSSSITIRGAATADRDRHAVEAEAVPRIVSDAGALLHDRIFPSIRTRAGSIFILARIKFAR